MSYWLFLKIAGSAFIIGSSSLFGAYYANRERRRIADLTAFKKALLLLQSAVGYAVTSLPEAMRLLAARQGRFAACFGEMAQRLDAKTGEGVAAVWQAALDRAAVTTYLAKEDTDCFRALGDALGVLDRNLQANNIRMALDYIDATTAALQQISAKNKKTRASLCVLGGVLIAVVLL